jgi:protease I
MVPGGSVAFNRSSNRPDRIDLAQIGEAGDIAVLLADGFDASDLTEVATPAERGGYRTVIVSPNKSLVSGRSAANEEMNFVVDSHPGEQPANAYAGLLVPGGERGLARLIEDQESRLFLQAFLSSGKPVLAMGAAAAWVTEAAGKTPNDSGDAVLALRGDLFAASGEDGRADAITTFVKTLNLVAAAA